MYVHSRVYVDTHNFRDFTLTNCYLYQAFDSGISNEGNTRYMKAHRNIVYSENLIEDCVYGIEMFIENTDPDIEARMDGITIRDNIILNSGFGFGTNRQYKAWDSDTAIMIHGYYNDLYDVAVENNIFYRSKTFLLCCMIKTKTEKASFIGNTYVQDNLGILCSWREEGDDISEYLFDLRAQATVQNIIGDHTATVVDLSIGKQINYTIAVMTEELVKNGILNNDWLFSLPYEGKLVLVDGENLDAKIEGDQFYIGKVPEEEGITEYQAGDCRIILNKVMPETLPDDAVLLIDGKDIRDQVLTVKAGKKLSVDCHFLPDGWKFQDYEESVSVWIDEGEGDWSAEGEGTKIELSINTPGRYRIGIMVTSGNAVAYRFFTLLVV